MTRTEHPRVGPGDSRLRREDSITIFEPHEEKEKQSNHLAEGSVNIEKGLVRTLQSSTESKFEDNDRIISPTDTVDH